MMDDGCVEVAEEVPDSQGCLLGNDWVQGRSLDLEFPALDSRPWIEVGLVLWNWMVFAMIAALCSPHRQSLLGGSYYL